MISTCNTSCSYGRKWSGCSGFGWTTVSQGKTKISFYKSIIYYNYIDILKSDLEIANIDLKKVAKQAEDTVVFAV